MSWIIWIFPSWNRLYKYVQILVDWSQTIFPYREVSISIVIDHCRYKATSGLGDPWNNWFPFFLTTHAISLNKNIFSLFIKSRARFTKSIASMSFSHTRSERMRRTRLLPLSSTGIVETTDSVQTKMETGKAATWTPVRRLRYDVQIRFYTAIQMSPTHTLYITSTPLFFPHLEEAFND